VDILKGKAGMVIAQWSYIREREKLEWGSSMEIHKDKAGMLVAQWRYTRAKLEWW
jgi:hypothetical protein